MRFYKEKEEDYVLVIGCGRLGASIANSLSNKNRNVTIIDKDKGAFRKLAPSFGGLALEGDGTDLNLLKENQIAQSSTLVLVTDNDNTNIMIAQMAKELFNVEHVIARLYDPEKSCIYGEFNIETICPSILSVNEVDKLLGEKEGTREDEEKSFINRWISQGKGTHTFSSSKRVSCNDSK